MKIRLPDDTDRIDSLIKSVIDSRFPDSIQDTWVKVLDIHPQTEEEILQVARQVNRGNGNNTIGDKFRLRSLDAPLREGEDSSITLGDMLGSDDPAITSFLNDSRSEQETAIIRVPDSVALKDLYGACAYCLKPDQVLLDGLCVGCSLQKPWLIDARKSLTPEEKKQKRVELRAQGICISCWQRPAAKGLTNCDSCRARMREWKQSRFLARFDALVDSDLIPTEEVADILGVSKRSVTARAQTGILKVCGVLGKKYYFSKASVSREKKAMNKHLQVVYQCRQCLYEWHPKIHALPVRPRCTHCGSRQVGRV